MSNNAFRGKIHYSWTQGYENWQPYQFQNFGKEDLSLKQEMNRWDHADRLVDNMESFPDVERMIKNIFSA